MTVESEPQARARAVQGMFGRIAPRYDLMNRLMTGGQDASWRREVIRRAAPAAGGWLLDLGAGTGDLARESLRRYPAARALAADFTLDMMRVGRARETLQPDWAATDALNLPYPAECFQALVSGFLLRNVTDLDRALSEQYRVLKPGGRWVALDTTRPLPSPLSPLIRFHMRRVIPLLGALLTGQREAYTYLPTTSEGFLTAEALAERIRAVGFKQVCFQRRMFGTIAIHWASK